MRQNVILEDGRSSRRDGSGGATQPRISIHACAVVQQDGLAVLHTGRGLMFKSNATGALIWEALAQQKPAGRVAEELVERYGIPAQQAEYDVARFISQLQSAGLLAGAGE